MRRTRLLLRAHSLVLAESRGDSRRITLHLPSRVYDELDRRAGLLGDRLDDEWDQ